MKDFELHGECVRCKAEFVCVAVRNGLYCVPCFTGSVENRVKITLAKSGNVNEVEVSRRKHLLIACSDGASSSVLASIMRRYMHDDERANSRFSKITLAYIQHEAAVNEHLEQHELPVVISQLHDVLVTTSKPDRAATLSSLLSSQLTETSRSELIRILRMHRLNQLAQELGCDVIFIAENNSRIAVNVIAMTAGGRGFAIPEETVAVSEWRDGLLVMRPLHNIDVKEIVYYAHYKGITSETTDTTLPVTINSLAEKFVLGLQKDFPSTVSTITRTANKIVTGCASDSPRCNICADAFLVGAFSWHKTHTTDRLSFEDMDYTDIYPETCYACQILLRERSEDAPSLATLLNT